MNWTPSPLRDKSTDDLAAMFAAARAEVLHLDLRIADAVASLVKERDRHHARASVIADELSRRLGPRSHVSLKDGRIVRVRAGAGVVVEAKP